MLTDGDDGKQLALRVGDAVTIRLSENSAAGYRWTISSPDDSRVEATREGYQATSAGVGSAGVSVWRLTAKRAGHTRVELKKSRPWESIDSSGERFRVDIDIIE